MTTRMVLVSTPVHLDNALNVLKIFGGAADARIICDGQLTGIVGDVRDSAVSDITARVANVEKAVGPNRMAVLCTQQLR